VNEIASTLKKFGNLKNFNIHVNALSTNVLNFLLTNMFCLEDYGIFNCLMISKMFGILFKFIFSKKSMVQVRKYVIFSLNCVWVGPHTSLSTSFKS